MSIVANSTRPDGTGRFCVYDGEKTTAFVVHDKQGKAYGKKYKRRVVEQREVWPGEAREAANTFVRMGR